MKIQIMNLEDIGKVLDLYINYYNHVEGSCLNEKNSIQKDTSGYKYGRLIFLDH